MSDEDFSVHSPAGFRLEIAFCQLRRLLRSASKRLALKVAPAILRAGLRWRRGRRVMVYYKYPDFGRKSEALADLFRGKGFDAHVLSGDTLKTRAVLLSTHDLWIGFWNQLAVEFFPKNYIFFNAEPLNVGVKWLDKGKWFKAMKGAMAVWGFRKCDEEYVAKLGVPFRYVPFGYAPYYESTFQKSTAGKATRQDIDVLFVGTVSERRQRVLDALSKKGMDVHIVSRANPAHGSRLDELLARSKIVLGVHYYDEPEAQILDLARLDYLLSNQLFVLHERPNPMHGDGGSDERVAMCDYLDLPEVCAYFLARPDERANRARRAQEWFKSCYALDRYIPYSDVYSYLQEI